MRRSSAPRTIVSLAVSALFIVQVLGVSASEGAASRGADKKLDRALKGLVSVGSSGDTIPVIVQYKQGARDTVADTVAGNGDVVVNDLGASSLVAQVKKANIGALAGSDAVEQLSLDAKVRGHQSPDPSVDPSQPPITQDVLRTILGLPATASGATGGGVGVAILDSGIRDAG